jgi:hypothetical protein
VAFAALGFTGCGNNGPAKANSGAQQIVVKVPSSAEGRTMEQDNINERVKRDNAPGSIKHLYVISAMSGDVLIYSTVKGKVTSSGKRLSPVTVNTGQGGSGVPISVAGSNYWTSEVLQDDGTYGSSIEYLYWFDQRGVYHQHYVTGGQILHISDQPLVVGKVIVNMELTAPGKK